MNAEKQKILSVKAMIPGKLSRLNASSSFSVHGLSARLDGDAIIFSISNVDLRSINVSDVIDSEGCFDSDAVIKEAIRVVDRIEDCSESPQSVPTGLNDGAQNAVYAAMIRPDGEVELTEEQKMIVASNATQLSESKPFVDMQVSIKRDGDDLVFSLNGVPKRKLSIDNIKISNNMSINDILASEAEMMILDEDVHDVTVISYDIDKMNEIAVRICSNPDEDDAEFIKQIVPPGATLACERFSEGVILKIRVGSEHYEYKMKATLAGLSPFESMSIDDAVRYGFAIACKAGVEHIDPDESYKE